MSQTVVVIGMGLIGGSIAQAIKKSNQQHKVIGVDLDERTLEHAKLLDVIDEQSTSIKEAAEVADTIVIATPVSKTVEIISNQLLDVELKDNVVITDVGSTKLTVMKAAEKLVERGVVFIGGHPMAGSHKSGVHGSRADLFENAFYVLVPSENQESEDATEHLKQLLEGSNAKFVTMDAKSHDVMAGSVSHLPHIVASALVHQLKGLEEEHPMITNLAAGGFKDITRIASANPIMWRDILLHNKDVLQTMMEEWRDDMERVTELIKAADANGLHAFFADAKRHRDGLPVKKAGAIPTLNDLYVDVPDHPGVISDVTGYLAECEISITNIRIIEAREDIMGVLRLSFRSVEERSRAEACLQSHKFTTYVGE
ncbi:prephenate dehydrogenase [Geomicrobium sp. JCM 19055]|uniref:prephenate dehydrogenase n=1 Tax=Geomicrobium sp. JCM 19055 TaxID=1460649 RepID=UPI00045EDC4B|nr:prephenate dehydrogenase [Geomicrobium sp. JCM 19055]GAJ98755.1 prephenate dehydrogenase [Geomicrobium sp. JCM 19055]